MLAQALRLMQQLLLLDGVYEAWLEQWLRVTANENRWCMCTWSKLDLAGRPMHTKPLFNTHVLAACNVIDAHQATDVFVAYHDGIVVEVHVCACGLWGAYWFGVLS